MAFLKLLKTYWPEKNKGEISVGFDADLAIWDDKKKNTNTEAIVQRINKLTPYVGKYYQDLQNRLILAARKFSKMEYVAN